MGTGRRTNTMFDNTAKIWKKKSAEYRLYSNLANGNDLFVSNIPDNAIHSFRNNFQLHIDEIVLYARDTSFWNDKNQGTVVTDWGVTCVPDNDHMDQIIQIPWEKVLYVEYSGETLYFFYGENRNEHYAIHISHVLKETNQYYAKKLAEIFTEMAETQVVETIDDIIDRTADEYDRLIDEGKTEEALSLALKFREEQQNVFFTPYVARYYFEKGQGEKAISILTEDYNSLSEDSHYWRNLLNSLRYDIYHELGDNVNARRYCLEVKQNSTHDMEFQDMNIQEESIKEFDIIENEFVQHFLELPYEERKLIVPVKSYSDLSQNTLSVLNLKNLPAINFPIGHPIANQLYVGHPYLPSKYIPFENYELELLEDKLREFCHVMQFLGATEINIESVNTLSSNNDKTLTQKANGGLDYKLASGNVDFKRDRASKFVDDISKSISLHQTFTPKAVPCLPDNLVWYSNEPSWQRIYDQRMQGKFDFNGHEERIETRKSQVIENSELKQISLEVKNLIVRANGSWEQSMEDKFEAHENAVLSIHVKFAPLDSLYEQKTKKEIKVEVIDEKKETPIKQSKLKGLFSNIKDVFMGKDEVSSNVNSKNNEQEYLDEVKACLEEDGKISPSERRLLNRIREKLGLSEKRAAELEAFLIKPQLTEGEQEYLEEYKACLEEDGEITPKARRMLDRFRNRLGISEERTLEIENLR